MKRLGYLGFGLLLMTVISMACTLPVLVVGGRETVRGSGDVVETSRDVSGFSRLVFAGQGNVFIEQGFDEGLRIEAEDNLIDYFEIDVRGDTLTIGVQERVTLRPSEPINFYLEVKELDRITLSGSGTVQTKEFDVENLELRLSGSGDIDVGFLDAISLDVTLSGSGNIDLAGFLENQDVTISGSGDYNSEDLESSITEVLISGSGSVKVRVEDQLDVLISGSGNVTYYGSPTIDQTITGSGSIRKLGE